MKPICLLMFSAFINIPSFAQNAADTADRKHQEDPFDKMIEYSRPGKYHKLLNNLEGKWTYKAGHPDSNGVVASYYYGSFDWKPFANGRFFIAELVSSKIQMPVQDGKTKEVNFQAIFTIGYNNVKKKFEETIISNMLGSDISFAEGTYDSTTNAISFYSENEPIPGLIIKYRDVFTFLNKDHYKLESFKYDNGGFSKINTVDCTRSTQ